MPIELFISYSHLDDELFRQLSKHLKPLEYEGIVQAWHDRRLLAGQEFDAEISKELDNAKIILLLVSPDFVCSEYCWGKEMARAMERHDSGQARVIPIILRPVDWQNSRFGKLSALPRDGRPVTTWPNQDEALLDIERGIRNAIKGSNSSPAAVVERPPTPEPVRNPPPPEYRPFSPQVPDPGAFRAKIHLVRNPQYADVLRMYKVTIDGNVVGKISHNSTMEFDVTAGDHNISLGIDWVGSNTLSLHVNPGEEIHLECGNNTGINPLKALMSTVNLAFYLYLRRIQ